MIWNRKMECASRDEIRQIQLAGLKKTVKLCYERVPHYKKKFDEIGLKPEHIRTLDDLKLIPFTTNEDLRENYPYGMMAAPMRDIVRLHGSSGTTGKPKIVGYTQNDLNNWTEAVARVTCAAGATPDDIVQISFGYGLFTGGFGLHYGLEKVGATIIPVSSGNTERQLMFMQDFGSTILVSTPAYALYMADVAERIGIDMSKIKLRLGLFGGEGHTEAMRKQIEKRWNMLSTENYGLCEVMGPGVSGECYKQNGLHIAEDMFIFEVIDPDTLEPLPIGEKGELVITPIWKEGMPVLRYRTRDITWLMDEPCSCGRTSMRMAKIQGRSDDMLIIRGVNVFPSQIEAVLMAMKEVEPHYEIVVTTEGLMDRIEVKVEISNPDLLDKFTELEKLRTKIAKNLYRSLNIDVKVTLVSVGSLKRFEGKARRVVDLRNKD
ncbi:MAG: phenylacetate--CoA ligase [Christensenellaceae bacterium]|nr:phenylacetate--CoA ligase [Christensenellaceae bacterium]